MVVASVNHYLDLAACDDVLLSFGARGVTSKVARQVGEIS